MVNKKNYGALIVPLFFLFSLGASLTTIGQKIEKHYVSSNQSNGIIYFIKPQEGFNSPKNGDLVYDISYLNSSDSCSFLFSYFDKAERTLDSIGFSVQGQYKMLPVSKIFIETTKNVWHYRYRTSLPLDDISAFFAQTDSPPLLLASKQGQVNLSMKKKRWKKLSSINNRILLVIKHNRQ